MKHYLFLFLVFVAPVATKAQSAPPGCLPFFNNGSSQALKALGQTEASQKKLYYDYLKFGSNPTYWLIPRDVMLESCWKTHQKYVADGIPNLPVANTPDEMIEAYFGPNSTTGAVEARLMKGTFWVACYDRKENKIKSFQRGWYPGEMVLTVKDGDGNAIAPFVSIYCGNNLYATDHLPQTVPVATTTTGGTKTVPATEGTYEVPPGSTVHFHIGSITATGGSGGTATASVGNTTAENTGGGGGQSDDGGLYKPYRPGAATQTTAMMHYPQTTNWGPQYRQSARPMRGPGRGWQVADFVVDVADAGMQGYAIYQNNEILKRLTKLQLVPYHGSYQVGSSPGGSWAGTGSWGAPVHVGN